MQPRQPNANIKYTPGQIAPGMATYVDVIFRATTVGSHVDQFGVISQHEKFNIGIRAEVLSEDDWEAHSSATKYRGLPPPRGKVKMIEPPTEAVKFKGQDATVATLQPTKTSGSLPGQLSFTSKDWVVDPSMTLEDIQNMSLEERMQHRKKQDFRGFEADDAEANQEAE